MAINVPSWLPAALGAVALLASALLVMDARSKPNSGELIQPERAYMAVTIG